MIRACNLSIQEVEAERTSFETILANREFEARLD